MIVGLPWNAWFGEETLPLALPDAWTVDVLRMTSVAISPSEIERRIVAPVAGPPLREAARGKHRVAIAIDDISRPTPVHACLPHLLDELKLAGVPEDAVQIFIASGAHRAPLRGEVARKIGEALTRRLKIVYHNPFDNLADLGETSNGVPILINKSFVDSDFRISVGGITPHDFAGFGGGFKTITVGLSGMQPLYDTHVKRIAEFSTAVGRLKGNRFQSYIQEIGRRVGIDFAVNIVMTARREVADLYSGEPQTVFDAACESARVKYATPCAGGYDVAILNAYPKDVDVTQSLMALNVAFFKNESLVREGGTVVVTTPAIDGAAIHYLGAEGMAGYVAPTRECLQGRHLVVYSPGLNRHDVAAYFPPGTASFQTWEESLEHLQTRHDDSARCCVVESATMQLLKASH